MNKYLPRLDIDLPLDQSLGISLEQLNAKNSIKSNVLQKHQVLRQQLYRPGQTMSANTSTNILNGNHDGMAEKQGEFNSMKHVLLPIFIVAIIFFDFLVLLYRFTWLKQVFRRAKLGAEQKIPTDHVAKRIHFALTGHEPDCPYESLDNPYQYYIENKDDFWIGNEDKYNKFIAASPKSKEDILKEIWTQKKRAKNSGISKQDERSFFLLNILRALKFVYKNLIAPFSWRFVLVGVFVIIIVVAIKTTHDLVTLDTATFLMDTRSTIPQFHRQIALSNQLLADLHTQTNMFLQEFQSSIRSEVVSGNSLLWNIVQEQVCKTFIL